MDCESHAARFDSRTNTGRLRRSMRRARTGRRRRARGASREDDHKPKHARRTKQTRRKETQQNNVAPAKGSTPRQTTAWFGAARATHHDAFEAEDGGADEEVERVAVDVRLDAGRDAVARDAAAFAAAEKKKKMRRRVGRDGGLTHRVWAWCAV